MKRNLWIVLVLLLIVSGYAELSTHMDSEEGIDLWPEIEPFQTDYLEVSDIHQIYYELCGNPHGKPVFVLHGGPGAACSPGMRRFFNPDTFLVVLHDQRGAGRSRPYGEIRQNTTQNLVEDIEQLRKHLRLQKIIVFGGSWGATLGLAYAETYPDNVSGMVLRGVFTATQEEIDHYYHGGVRKFFPETYDRLIAALPEPDKRPLPNYLLNLIHSEDSTESVKYSKAWGRYEGKIAMLEVTDKWLEKMGATISDVGIKTFALLENYYTANGCFLEEGQLLRDVEKILDIPIIMVNGRYDMICPPITAYRLHQKLPKSKLVIVESAGHWDKSIERALLKAMKEFE